MKLITENGQTETVATQEWVNAQAGGETTPGGNVTLTPEQQESLAKADSAVQPEDLAAVATSGRYEDLEGKPEPSSPSVDLTGILDANVPFNSLVFRPTSPAFNITYTTLTFGRTTNPVNYVRVIFTNTTNPAMAVTAGLPSLPTGYGK